MNNINYRELKEEDLKILAEKYREYYNGEEDNWTYDLAYKRLYKEFKIIDSIFLGIFNEDEILGFIMGDIREYSDISVFFLEEILIFKKYQDRGYGSKIIKELENRLIKRNVAKIGLMTTHSEKHQKFYKRLGFTENDFLVNMKKEIGAI